MLLVHPHTLTALAVLLSLMFYAATRSNYEDTADNIKLGILAAVACFVFIGMLQFPDGPFVRPSKPIWRAVLSLSVLYQLFLTFLLFLVKELLCLYVVRLTIFAYYRTKMMLVSL
jgi:phosphatidylserine synthase 2